MFVRTTPTRARSMARVVAGAALFATVVTSCGADGSGVGDAAVGAATSPAPTPGSSPADGSVTTVAGGGEGTTTPVAAPDALRFTAPLVGGGTLDLATYAGSTVVFWFWAPG